MASSLILSADVKQTTTAKTSEENDNGTPPATTLGSCASDPDFAIICAFLQKFNKDLGIEMPNIKHLQEWLTKNEVSPNLRDLHIKLLRKTRKTVHEKSWESAISKFCFTYSAQDGWEIERFGYKNSSIKVKLRILKELLESQFERNMKFRAKILTINADTLRSQPIGRDRLGHTYWMIQDNDCNFRIYQEHLDEEIWQVVATNRDEFVNLIKRLKGNEVVLPSANIGVTDEDTTSSTSSSSIVQEDNEDIEEQGQHKWRQKIPNIRIKLNNHLEITQEQENNVNETKLTNLMQKDSRDVKDDNEMIMRETDEVKIENSETLKQEEIAVHMENNIVKIEIERKVLAGATEIKPESEIKVVEEVETLDKSNMGENTSSFVDNSHKKRVADSITTTGEEKYTLVNKKCRLSNRNEKDDDYDYDKPALDSAEQNNDEKYKETLCVERHNKIYVIDDKCSSNYIEGKVKVEDEIEGKKNDVVKEEEQEEEEEEEYIEEEDIDSAAAEEGENEEKEIEEFDQDDEDAHENKSQDIIEESVLYVHGNGAGNDCYGSNIWLSSMSSLIINDELTTAAITTPTTIVEDVIEEELFYVYGEGNGNDCLVGNDEKHGSTSPASTSSLKESETLTTLSLENIRNKENDDNHHVITSKQIEDTSTEDHDKALMLIKLELKSDNSETQLKNNTNSSFEKQLTGQSEVIKENSNVKSKGDTLSQESKIATIEKRFEKDDTIKIQGKSVLNMSNKCTTKEKMSVLETIKKELRESKQKSLENNIQMIKESNITHAAAASAAATPGAPSAASDRAVVTATATTAHAVDTACVVAIQHVDGADGDAVTGSDEIPASKADDTAYAADRATASTQSVAAPAFAAAAAVTTVRVSAANVNTTVTTTTSAATAAAITSNTTTTTTTTVIAVNANDNSAVLDKSSIIATTISKCLPLSRKRRLDDITVQSKIELNNSESDIDRQSENAIVLSCVEDTAAGGKRLRCRGKQTNMDLRKKVEAQKVAAKTDTTSSSGEEDSTAGGKNVKLMTKQKLPLLSAIKDEAKSIDSPEETHCFHKKVPPDSHQLSLPDYTKTQVEVKSEINSNETIENNVNENAKSTEQSMERHSVAKKPIIMKPLKKNLLTQIQQQVQQQEQQKQSEREKNCDFGALNKKRIVATKIKLEVNETELVNVSSDKATESKNCTIEDRDEYAAFNRDVDVKDIKKTTEHEMSNQVKSTSNHTSDNCESSLDAEKDKVEIDKPTHIKVMKVITIKRRSGRRGSGTVLHTELHQPKRTRNVVKKTVKPIKKGEIMKTIKPASFIVPDVKGLNADQPDVKSNVIKCDEGVDKPKENKEPLIQSKTKKEEVKALTIKPVNTKMEKTAIKIPSEKLNPAPTTSNINTSTSSIRGKGSRKKSDVDTINIIDTIDSETPVRQSRRIAQQKIREEAERRKLEEIALRTMKQELKKKKKAEKQSDPTVFESSEPSSESEDSMIDTKRRIQKRKCPGKNGNWSSDSDDQEEIDDEEDEEPHHYETDPGSPLFKSDHEFSPESDLEDETQIIPMKRARTVKKEDAMTDDDVGRDEEESCQKCGKSDHPEWILLCDICDKGYHCSCLSPVLFYIPEGDWYCPPCQQEQLIAALENKLKEFDHLVLLKKQEEEEKRLAVEKEELEKLKEYNEPEVNSDSSDEFLSITKTNNTNKYKNNDDMGRSNSRTNRRRRRAKLALSESDSQDDSSTSSKSNSSSSFSESDNEPIYKLRKRRQINVSYRLNEYDNLINSALQKEMDEAAGAGNLGRGKDITTIIEADKEEKARQKQLEEERIAALSEISVKEETLHNSEVLLIPLKEECKSKVEENEMDNFSSKKDDEIDIESNKRKLKPKLRLKKKSRKLTKLDISTEDDDPSDEDFKTFSVDGDDDEEEDDEDSLLSTSSGSDSILEVSRRRSKKKFRQRKAARRSIRKRRKGRKFVIEDSDEDDEDNAKLSTLKKKAKRDSDYSETEIDDEYDLSELSENIDSADLCDDTTSEESDGQWSPNKRKKHSKQHSIVNRNSIKCRKNAGKKQKKVEYSDDDISESEEDDDDDADDNIGKGSGKGSGKQPRSQPVLKHIVNTVRTFTGKGKGKVCPTKNKKKTSQSSAEDEVSFSDSGDSARRTRGRRYAYIEDFDDDSSDGGIKPGVQRPDTPPEEREKFIKRQEEIKRMLAEKNAEGAKMAATPRLTPIKSNVERSGADKKLPSKSLSVAESLSTVPMSVIRQAKALDVDYLQRKGESINDLENDDVEDGDGVDDFDDADLPDDLPDDMDEDAIARMVEDEEDFGAAASRDLSAADDVLKTISTKVKVREDKPTVLITPITNINPVVTSSCATSVATHLPLLSAASTNILTSNLQEPTRKRLPMPTTHPPLLRHQFPLQNSITSHILPRIQHGAVASHLLQNALSAPLSQPLLRNYPLQTSTTHSDIIGRLNHGVSLMPSTSRSTQNKSPNTSPLHLVSPTCLTKDVHPNLHSKGQHAVPFSQSMLSAAIQHEGKPRGRRKKITPLRDTLQKQQAAAAASAAATTVTTASPNKIVATTMVENISVIKGRGLPLSTTSLQTSVITTLSQLSHSAAHPSLLPPATISVSAPPVPGLHQGPTIPPMPPYSTAEGFYGSSSNGSILMGIPHRTPASHNLQSSSLRSHSAITSPYGLPPPLRGSSVNVGGSVPPSNRTIPTTSNVHTRFPTSVSLAAAREHQLSSYICATRPTGPPLNHFRTQLYNNTSFGARLVPSNTSNLRRTPLPPPHNIGYSINPRSFPPYVYYPPPPPLTTQIQSQQQRLQRSSPLVSAPSQAIVTASESTSVIVIAPPAMPSIIVSSPNASVGDHPKSPNVTSKSRITTTTTTRLKSPPPSPDRFICDSKSITNQLTKKLTALDTYTPNTAVTKSPLPLDSHDSLNATNSSSIQIQTDTDPPGDSSSSHEISDNPNADQTIDDKDRIGSEFSGLVSYFSSQHNDYNT